MYNGKVSLFIDYQFNLKDQKCCTDSIYVTGGEFEDYNHAYRRMQEVMPTNFNLDDGWEWDEWDDDLLAENDDVFTQYVAYTDNDHYFLAVLRPVIEEVTHE